MEPSNTEPQPAQPTEPSTSPQPTTPPAAAAGASITPTPEANPLNSPSQPGTSSTSEVFGGNVAAPSSNPSAVSGGSPVPPSAKQSWKRLLNKKPLVLGIVAAVVVLGGAAAYYFGYYMNPSVVYSQSLSNTSKGYDKLVDYLDSESKMNYKGYTGDGSYQAGSGSFATDGKLSFRSDGDNTNSTLDVNVGSTRVALEARTIKSKTVTPDLYFKVNGLATLKSLIGEVPPSINTAITKYDGQWIMLDQALVDKLDSLSGMTASGSPTVTEPTQDQIRDEEHAFGKVNQQYLFSSEKDKAVLTVVENLGSEAVDGHKTYHYKVALVKDNVKKYITAQRDALKASKLNSWLKANNYENYVDLVYDSLQQSANNIKETDTFELWADKGQRMIYKVRFADKKDPSKNYVDIGQDHTGGTSYPFFIKFYSKNAISTTDGSFVVTLDTEQKDTNFKLAAKSTGTSGFDLSANFKVKPTNNVSPIAAPTSSVSLTQVLNDLGLGDYLTALQTNSAATSTANNTARMCAAAYEAQANSNGKTPIPAECQ